MNEKNPTISKGVDWSLAWIYLILVAVGITAIFAVTYKEGDAIVQSFLGFKTDYSKQFYFFINPVINVYSIISSYPKQALMINHKTGDTNVAERVRRNNI